MADGFDPGGFDAGGFFTGDGSVPPPPPPPPPPPVTPPLPIGVPTGDPRLVYHADTDDLELLDQFSPKRRRGATYRGHRRRTW